MEIIGSIVLGIGLIALGAALFTSGRKRVKRCTTQTVGRITGVRESEDRDSDGDVTTDYTPEFEFVVNGQVYHGTGDTSYNRRKKVKIGGSINVFYDPEDPREHYTRGGGKSQPVVGVVFIILGVLTLLGIFKG